MASCSWPIPSTTRWRRTWRAFKHLEDNLKTLNLKLDDIPYVIQYNKRDLPDVAPVEYMEFLLNNREVQVPTFEAGRAQGAKACSRR